MEHLSTGVAPDKQAFVDLERRLNEATRKKDLNALGLLLHDDFVVISTFSFAEFTPRNRWIENLLAMEIEAFSLDVARVRIYPGTAVVNCRGNWKVSLRGRDLGGAFILTDVWISNKDAWQVVVRHASQPLKAQAQ
jgi:uncharacterized protein DUF4440